MSNMLSYTTIAVGKARSPVSTTPNHPNAPKLSPIDVVVLWLFFHFIGSHSDTCPIIPLERSVGLSLYRKDGTINRRSFLSATKP